MADVPINSFASIEDVYPTTAARERERLRWQRLVVAFKEKYGCAPTHIVRAPGRVNILGEHIDYSLFPVIPAAIEQDILIAVSTSPPSGSSSSPPRVQIANTSTKYPSHEFELRRSDQAGEWEVVHSPGCTSRGKKSWVEYAQASILETASKLDVEQPVSMDWLVDGAIPEGAGLSSSAAFVVASVTGFLVANLRDKGVTQGEVVQLALASEHRLGLRTGGMDQAASVFCLPGQLLHLSFHPELSPALLPLPSSLAIVITNSLAPHTLAASAADTYNLRVVENLCGVQLLLHALKRDGEQKGDSPHFTGEKRRLWMKEALAHWEDDLGLSEEDVQKTVLRSIEDVLGDGDKRNRGWTEEEMIVASGMEAEEFRRTFMQFIEVRATHFHLYKRAKHTLEESLRVLAFKHICEAANSKLECPETLQRLGDLINASHYSLRDVYDCTVPPVDELQRLCLASGSLGSRQTGGGWGGAVVSLVPTDKIAHFLSAIKTKYGPYREMNEEELGKAVFATAPGCGAGVLSASDGFLASLS